MSATSSAYIGSDNSTAKPAKMAVCRKKDPLVNQLKVVDGHIHAHVHIHTCTVRLAV